MDIDGQGEHRIVDDDGSEEQELEEEEEEQDGEQQDYMEEVHGDGRPGQSPPLDEEDDEPDYDGMDDEDNDEVAEADQ